MPEQTLVPELAGIETSRPVPRLLFVTRREGC